MEFSYVWNESPFKVQEIIMKKVVKKKQSSVKNTILAIIFALSYVFGGGCIGFGIAKAKYDVKIFFIMPDGSVIQKDNGKNV